MIKVMGRNFDSYQKAIKFLEMTIKMEKNPKISEQLKRKLGYLLVEKDIEEEKQNGKQ
jgi:hypothetical protein